MARSTHNAEGREVPDQEILSVPSGWQRPPSLHEQMQRFIRAELSRHASDRGRETFQEADDFDVDDDEPLPFSQYEIPEEMPLDGPGGVVDVDAAPPTDPKKKTPEEPEKPVPEDSGAVVPEKPPEGGKK